MKEKNKKILKGLGVGALACVGLFGLTGCSIDLTQEQMDKIMYTVDNSDQFMQDTLDLLEKQNNQLDTKQAWNLFEIAKTKLLLNDEGIRDNIKITLSEDGEVSEMGTYKTANGEYFEFTVGSNFKSVIFEQDGIVYDYYYDAERGVTKTEIGSGSSEQYFTLYECIPYASYVKVKEDNIYACELLDNGNYEISFINTWTDEPEQYLQYNLVKVEISQDAQYISENILIGSHILNKGEGNTYWSFNKEKTVKYEYNTITDEDFSELLEEAKNAEVTSQE